MTGDREKSAAGAASGRARFGVKAKLLAAFGAVAAMTVIAALVGIMSFSATERGFQQVAGHEVPVMTDAMRLSVTSGEISAAAARFVSAKTAADHKAITAVIHDKGQALKDILNRLRAGGEGAAFARVEAVSRRLDGNLAALEAAISERSTLRARLESELDGVHKTHARV